MTAENFCFWLKGFFEIAEQGRVSTKSGENTTFTPAVSINEKQLMLIRNKLDAVSQEKNQ